jgi:hypothetical protein
MNKSYVSQAKKKAKKYGVEIEVSKRKDKKFHVIDTNIHFGAKGYTDYILNGDDTKRKRFHDRFKNNPSYSDKNSGLYYSARILW